jgi:hypothetical protein
VSTSESPAVTTTPTLDLRTDPAVLTAALVDIP